MSSAQLPPPTKIQMISKWLMTKGGSSLALLKKIKLTRSRRILAFLVTVIGLIASIIGIFTDIGKLGEIVFGTPTPTPITTKIIEVVTVTETPDPIRSATENEILILISEFYYSEGNPSTDIHREIQDEILAQAQASQIENVRVEIYPIAISPDDKDQAEEIGEKYHAALVIWGADTGVRVQAHLLNVGAADPLISEVIINETWCSRLANPSAYVTFVTDDLPGQLSYFSLFALSRTQYFDGDLQGSLHTLETAMELLEGEVTNIEGLDKALFHLGFLYDALGDPQKALELYTQSIDLNPYVGTTFGNRGILYHGSGDYEAALDDYNRALELNPENSNIYNSRGNLYSEFGDHDAALADYNRAVELNPDGLYPVYNRGLLYHDLGEYEAALSDYNRALEIDPEDSFTYGNRGRLYFDLGEYDAALVDYNRALELNPEDSGTYSNRGNLYFELGDYDAALSDYNRALELNPEDSGTYSNRGNLYKDTGDSDAALADYNRSIELAPNESLAYGNRGALYYDLGDYEAALADYNKAIELDPEDNYPYSNRGALYYDLGDYQAALADYNQALVLDPTFGYAYRKRGILFLSMGRLDSALADFAQATAYDPENSATMSDICRWLGLYQRAELALPYCNLAVELDDTLWSRDSRGLVNALLGNYAEAIADFEAVIAWAEEGYPDWTRLRYDWIEALTNNINPFTDEVLEALKDE